MTAIDNQPRLRDPFDHRHRMPIPQAPYVRAPEAAKTIFIITTIAACGPLLAGIVFFGWRAATIALISVATCVVLEGFYYRITRKPTLLGRSHAVLTGVLLALTLPAFAPWYVPVTAAVFAIIVGKGFFGGVGHFVWQPALVGRLAAAVLFPVLISGPSPTMRVAQWPLVRLWPIVAQQKAFVGNVNDYAIAAGDSSTTSYHRWLRTPPPAGRDALLVPRAESTLASLTRGPAQFSGLVSPGGGDQAKPAALLAVPPVGDAILGAIPGGIGETSAVAILVAGLYLIYRRFIKVALPLSILLSAAAVVAVAPISLDIGREASVWFPIFHEGLDVGIVYVTYHLAIGELALATMFLATEMTTRPVTTGGQVLFGAGIGALAMLLRLYTPLPVPCYIAVLFMNSFTPLIDRLWRPRVLGKEAWVAAVLHHHPH